MSMSKQQLGSDHYYLQHVKITRSGLSFFLFSYFDFDFDFDLFSF